MSIKKPFYFAIALYIFSFNALAQVCQTPVKQSTPSTGFVDHNNGTVTHNKTGLMWKVCSEGQTWSAGTCTGTASTYAWNLALQHVSTANASGGFAAHTDWRLPNIKELLSIREIQCDSPIINSAIFPSTPSVPYWSSTPYSATTTFSEYVDFAYGYSGSRRRTYAYSIRLVRNAN